ncbi:Sir2 histone deacetylase Hst2, partial [Serendipita sp. 399]
ANLAKLNLPYPEAVFDIHYFRDNPQPFYTLARDIAPGKFIPTPTHAFIRLLHEKGKLHTCFTQNIDTLERIAGVPLDKIVEAHGSFASSRCIDCETPYDQDEMMRMVRKAEVPKCPDCDGLVKPDIVFFGEGLPASFINAIPALRTEASLVIIMGTSLMVHPFALLPNLVPVTCPRVLLNMDPAGNIGAFVKDRAQTPPAARADGGGSDDDDDGDKAPSSLSQGKSEERANVEKSGGEEVLVVAGHVDRQPNPDRVEDSGELSTSGFKSNDGSEQKHQEEEAREDEDGSYEQLEDSDEYEDVDDEEEEDEAEEDVERRQDDVVHL